jgi:hypothetical protein
MRVVALALLGSLAACIDARSAMLDLGPAADGAPASISESYVQGQHQLDVLFVIDNSSGMGATQQGLVSQIGPFIDRLQAAKVDWRIGVVSTDLGIAPYHGPGCERPGGDNAELLNAPQQPGCKAPSDRFISPTNVADPKAAFACIASLGESGCGFERPFDAALRALDPKLAPAANKSFGRETALLLVVWLSNEDDCSAVDPSIYNPDDLSLGPWASGRCFAQDITCTGQAPDGSLTQCVSGKKSYLVAPKSIAMQLKGLRPSGGVAVIAVVGPPTPVWAKGSGAETTVAPSCTTTDLEARPGIRFLELTSQFEDGAQISICEPDLGGRLSEAASRLKASPGNHCLQHALRDPARPACSVAVTLPTGRRWDVPPSAPGTPGFYLVHPVTAGCAAGALAFDEAAQPPLGATVTLRCDFAK